jgi:hypothetical protein
MGMHGRRRAVRPARHRAMPTRHSRHMLHGAKARHLHGRRRHMGLRGRRRAVRPARHRVMPVRHSRCMLLWQGCR